MSVNARLFVGVTIFIAVDFSEGADVATPCTTYLPRRDILTLAAKPVEVSALRYVPAGATDGESLLVLHREVVITTIRLDQHLCVSISQLFESLGVTPNQSPGFSVKGLLLRQVVQPLRVDARQGDVARWFGMRRYSGSFRPQFFSRRGSRKHSSVHFCNAGECGSEFMRSGHRISFGWRFGTGGHVDVTYR